MWIQSLGWEDLLEEGMATHSSILAWRIPWSEEFGGLQSRGAWWAKDHGVIKESDMTQQPNNNNSDDIYKQVYFPHTVLFLGIFFFFFTN